ncbi:DUF2867 domain-containing protein [Stenotrophomonas sp. MH1]|uniref:DUF2867 domain-containing protein n=1 Tax=Stenotrophomonas capsici TaxID=3110230 RepID=A0ABU5V698_9GAMM|nr:DUF2867 domain-containing protein [Stenotrophomonas sp. MH1]MEA5668890.1 DUF2867 domain-containing protein [Stenotrophomonas sp. MH1]
MERTRTTRDRSFPRVSIAAADGRRAVEVTLLSQLDPGAGDALALRAGQRQQHHPQFNDALDEPSVRLSAPDFAAHDPASLYTFSVGSAGHPFHRHAGPRLFTAVSGSGGARLRFIPATSSAEAGALEGLRHVEIPADCLFTVRMAARTWHQFQPLHGNGQHPALFAVSCHPDETAGELDPATRAQVDRGEADLASLTELLPPALLQALSQLDPAKAPVPTTTLGFIHAMDTSWCIGLCAHLRRHVGRARQTLARLCRLHGVVGQDLPALRTCTLPALPARSLLAAQLHGHHHQDSVQIRIDTRWLGRQSPEHLLVRLLEAFIEQPAAPVSGLMRFRNLLVKPLGLRTSTLGCPVSSLLNDSAAQRFAQRFPVLDAQVDAEHAQVLLGADDRHLGFRSGVSVQRDGDDMLFTLSTRVRCRNLFGRAYMGVVDPVHRHYIAPRMLQSAVAALVRAEEREMAPAGAA